MMRRDHPFMTRRSGLKNWPPPLTALSAEKKDWPAGEIGTLRRVWKHKQMHKCLFLFIEHKRKEYTCMMYFDDPKFCRYILFLLDSQIGKRLQEIGNIDVSHTR